MFCSKIMLVKKKGPFEQPTMLAQEVDQYGSGTGLVAELTESIQLRKTHADVQARDRIDNIYPQGFGNM